MDPNVAPPTGSTTTPGESGSDLDSTLRRIEARLERLERTLDPITAATAAAPALTSTAVDVLDDWAHQHGDLDERLRRICQDHKFRPAFISIQIQGLSEEGQKVEQETSFF